MTTPPDPYATPSPGSGQPGETPYGQPQYGEPQYGEPQYGEPYAWSDPSAPAGGYASWGRRVGGYLLDGLLLVPFFVLAGIGGGAGGGGGALLVVIGYVGAVVFAIWNQAFRQGRTGKSLGKEWVGIRLIRDSDGQPIGPGLSFLRQIAHFVDSIAFYIGWLWPLWDRKRQTFADKLCGTVVVRDAGAG